MNETIRAVGDYLNNWAKILTKNDEYAKDLVQDTFLKCLGMKDRYSHLHPSQQRQVALTTMRNIFIDSIRRGGAKKRYAGPFTDYSECEAGVYQEDLHGNKQLIGIINKVSDDIAVKSFILFYSGYSCKEVSEITGRPLATAKGDIWRGRKKLRGILEQPKKTKNTNSDKLVEMREMINRSASFYQVVKQ